MVRRPDSVPTSPVNWPERWTVTRVVSLAPKGRRTSSLPRDNHKEWRGAISLLVEYFATLYLTRATVWCNTTNCVGVNFGNICSMRALANGRPLYELFILAVVSSISLFENHRYDFSEMSIWTAILCIIFCDMALILICLTYFKSYELL